MVFSFLLATTCFGPIYLAYALFLMTKPSLSSRTKKNNNQYQWRDLLRREYVIGVLFQAIFWPCVYVILAFGANWDYWFYYFDFLWFALAFVPIAFHGAYSVLWRKYSLTVELTDLDVTTTATTEDSGKSGGIGDYISDNSESSNNIAAHPPISRGNSGDSNHSGNSGSGDSASVFQEKDLPYSSSSSSSSPSSFSSCYLPGSL